MKNLLVKGGPHPSQTACRSPLAQTFDRIQTDTIEQREGRDGHVNSAHTGHHIQTDKITGH